MVRLHGRAMDGVTLASAIQGTGHTLTGAIAILYAPARCHLGRLEDGEVRDESGVPVALDPVYEARLFNQKAELRWLHDGQGLGRAVWLSEDESEGLAGGLSKDVSLEYIDTIGQSYLLWGRRVEESTRPGWSVLSAGRIGRLSVPVEVPADQGARLKTLEYVIMDGDGNASVAEERLIELVPGSAEPAGARHVR